MLVCRVFAPLMLAACTIQERNADTAKTASSSSASTAARVTSEVTFLSARTVDNGDFTDNVLIQQILDTARVLRKSDWDNVHDRRDERRLLTGDCSVGSKTCVPGPFARIVARKNVHLTRPADLGKGRIVGRILNLEKDQSIPYPKLGLHAGTLESYWWIGVRPNPANSSRMDTLSVYVPADWSSSKPAKWRIVGMVRTDPTNSTYRHQRSSARFVWNDNDDETWVSCVSNGCCEPPMSIMDSTNLSGKAMMDAIESR